MQFVDFNLRTNLSTYMDRGQVIRLTAKQVMQNPQALDATPSQSLTLIAKTALREFILLNEDSTALSFCS